MRKIYKYLELNNYKELNLILASERILSHVKRKTKKEALLSVLNNVSEVVLKYSIKDQNSESLFELQIIEIEIEEPKLCTPIIEAFEDAIPYAVLIVFVSKDKYLLAYFDKELRMKSEDYVCSNWIYEEELSDEFLPYVIEEVEEYEENDIIDVVISKFGMLVNNFYYLEYLCFRRLIDILKIREIVWHKKYVADVLSRLYDRGNIEFIDEMIYAIRTTIAESVFNEVDNSYYGDRTMIDERYGIDHFYEKMTADEATTINQAEEYYLNLERGRIYL